MKRLLLVIIGLAMASQVLAAPVSATTARNVALSFLHQQGCQVRELADMTAQMPYTEFYLFCYEEGFVLVAGDDCVAPILGYSTTTPFTAEKVPAHIADWLQGYDEQIAWWKGSDDALFLSQAVRNQWDALLGGPAFEPPLATSVSPLLTTTWKQSTYYNSQCPYDYTQESYTVTGCVATATAQVMKYWNYPTAGYGSHSYSHDTYGTQSANFAATTYQWGNMPTALSSTSTQSQINAVATLMYHIGVAVEMDYGVSSSSATTTGGNLNSITAENALRKYFKYSPLLHSIARADYSDAVWSSKLRNELDNSRVVLYSGRDVSAGHAFVLDGYDQNGRFHINWGWGGYCDGYYYIGGLNPASGGTGGNTSHSYNMSNKAIIGIMPNNGFGSSTDVVVSSNNISLGTVTGNGTYSFADTVRLYATAQEGCRFVQWSNGDKRNSLTFIATGGSVNLTAQFEPLSGDTLGYCTANTRLLNLGYNAGGTVRWGVRLPASTLTPGHHLRAVQFVPPHPGTYNLTVYTGTSSPSNAVATASYSAGQSELDVWNTIMLQDSVHIDGTKNIWLTFACSDNNYPAALTYNSGNPDGILWGSSLNPLTNREYSWMIRGIFGQLVEPYVDVTVYCNGDGIYWTDTTSAGYFDLCGQTFRWKSGRPLTLYMEHDHNCADVDIDSIFVNGINVGYNTSVFDWTDWSNYVYWLSIVPTVSTEIVFTTHLFRYNLYVLSADESMGTVEGSGEYACGETATITALPASGYHFVSWNDNNTSNPRQLQVDNNLAITARFAPNAGIEAPDGGQLSATLMPNPASGETQLTLNGIEGVVEVKVVDLTGRTVLVLQAAGDASQPTTLDLSGVQPGSYFVHIVGDNASLVRKLVVK